ncbi:MAG: hypothetical protein R3208_19640 [Ketobacteraceae bacterium]|nr:hypothetical protein [Ketobacteraceae bacterium]
MTLKQELSEFIKSHQKLGRQALKSLKNQIRGGENNAKGSRHENYFAVFQIAVRFPSALTRRIFISAQADAFVDDLVVVDQEAGARLSYQLKDAVAVDWRGTKGILGYFFRQHILDCEYHQMPDARTVLVLGNQQVYEKLKASVPEAIAAHTDVIYFENTESPNRLLLSNPEFRKAVEALCISSAVDKLEMIVQGLLGAWMACSPVEQDLEKIVQKAIRQTRPNLFRNFYSEEDDLDPDFRAIIDSIDGLRYEVTNGSFSYSVGGFTGVIPHRVGSEEFRQLCNRIVSARPESALKLVEALMGVSD